MSRLGKGIGLLMAILMLLLVAGCNSADSDSKKSPEHHSSEKPTNSQSKPVQQDKTAIEAQLKLVIEENVQAMNDENFTKYMAMLSNKMDPEVRKRTEEGIKSLFADFDLQATLKRFKVVHVSDDYAVIEVEQDTISLNNDPRFKNNRSVAEHTLVKEDNQWKIKSTALLSAKEIDSSGNVIN